MIQSQPVFYSMDTPSRVNSVHHSGSSRYVQPIAPHLGDEVRILIRTSLDAPIQRIILRTCPDGEQLNTPMKPYLMPSSLKSCSPTNGRLLQMGFSH